MRSRRRSDSAVWRFGGSAAGLRRGLVQVVLRQVGEQVAHRREAGRLGVVHEVGDAAGLRMHIRTAELVEAHLFVGDSLHHVRAGHEHVAHAPNHEDEVGDRGAVDGTAGAGAQNHRDLRDDPGGERIPQEDVGVATQRCHTLLDPRTARIVDSDDGSAVAERQVHHLADLLGEGLGERPAEDREILGEHVHQAAIHPAVAGHHPVTQNLLLLEPEVGAAVRDEPVQLDEGPRVEQQIQPFPRRELPLLVLLRQPVRPAALLGERLLVMQLIEEIARIGHVGRR